MANPMMYKGRPVVRDQRKLYFGEPFNPYIIVLTVLENHTVQGLEVPARILVQLQSTDPALAMKSEKIIKEAERKNLYDALEIGSIWLERQLAG